MGIGRAANVVTMYLVMYKKFILEEAISTLKQKRPIVKVNKSKEVVALLFISIRMH